MVRSAVSSVSTPGVLVTMMPGVGGGHVDVVDAGAEVGDQLQLLARLRDQLGVDLVGDGRAQHVARPTASISCSRLIGSSVRFSSVSNSSRIRVSTGSGSLRVTMTFGLRAAMCDRKKGRFLRRSGA
jgi:hypothetical protein